MNHSPKHGAIKRMHYLTTKLMLYNMYLQNYWDNKALDASKKIEVDGVLNKKKLLIMELYELVTSSEYKTLSAVLLLREENYLLASML